MEIYINNQQAALKQGTSFEYIAENRYFTDSDSYTLAITLPLAGCPQNLAIFGNINRKDVNNPNTVMSCEIRDRKFYKKGVVAITELTQSDVKIQFLADRSVQNYNTSLDDIYINELDLGKPHSVNPADFSVRQAWGYDSTSANYMKYIAIPWVNNNTSSGNIQNEADYDSKTYLWTWNKNTSGLSFMPYMLYIAKKVCEAIGFTYDFSEWESSTWRFLLCCNALPYAWEMPQFAYAMPHWTVYEFFQQLEYLMQCEFNFDFNEKSVTFEWPDEVASNAGTVELTNVLDEFTYSADNILTEDSDSKKPQLFKYADSSILPSVWNRYTCSWLIEKNRTFVKELNASSFEAFKEEWGVDRGFFTAVGQTAINKILANNPCPYIIHYLDTYFIVVYGEKTKTTYVTSASGKHQVDWYARRLQPIAMFAHWLSDDDEDDATTINIVPATIEDTEKGECVYLTIGDLDNEDAVSEEALDTSAVRKYSQLIEAGEDDESQEYLSNMCAAIAWQENSADNEGKHYCPIIDNVYAMKRDFNAGYWHGFDINGFRLSQNRAYTAEIGFNDIDTTQKYTFKFISDTLPNVRSIFIIQGKRYVAEKITATFTENGMSSLIKGVFYRVK